MSSAGAEPRAAEAPPGWVELERAVERLLADHARLRSRLGDTEARIRELEVALKGVASGEMDPSLMAAELETLRERNGDLDARMEEARARIERVMARLRFVEDAS